ncbi:MAG: TonB-dependent receptor, partial [Candidatus Binatia bacterium]
AIGGPLVGSFVNFRVAALSDERDGLIENTTALVDPKANRRTNARDRSGVRMKLGFPDLFGADLVVGYERSDVFLEGAGSELGIVQPRLIPFYRSWDPSFDAISGNFVSSVDGPEFTNIVGDTFSANASHDVGGWGFDAVGGYSSISYLSVADADLGPAPILLLSNGDDNPQTTFELRVTSPRLPGFYGLDRVFGFPLGSTELTAGFFYQRRLIEDSELRLEIGPAAAAQFLAFQNAPEGTPVPALADFIGPAVPIGTFGTFDTTQGNEIDTVFFDQTSNALAGFGQMEWHFLERWTLQYGMRLGHETKKANWVSVAEQGTGAIALAALGREQFTQSLDRSELQFTPKVMLRHDLTDDVNVYAGWVRGFRAGGYNEFTSTGDPETLEFDPEQVTSWEIGTKMDLLGGAARLNVGGFWMELTDFQVLTQDPDEVTFSVENAGEARARGIEVDSMWLPTSWLTLTGSLGFNDSEFIDFPFGTCPGDRPDTDGDGDERCDLSGEPLDFAPKWLSAVTASVRFPLSSILGFAGSRVPSLPGIDLTGGLTMQYQDVHFLDVSVRDPRVRQPAFFRFDGSFGFENPGQGWALRFVAQNFTDEFTNAIKSDVPLADGTFYQLPEPPRLVFGELRWSF